MGNYRTKEDDVYKIFTSVFITNFPESCSADELFQSCKQYGQVVDTFIPNKRFHRTPLNEKKSMPKKAGGVKKDTGVNEEGNSYAHVVKGQMQPGNKESEATPALVLSDECLLSKDLSKSLFGRVKQFALLANIRKAVSFTLKEGTDVVGMHAEESRSDNIVNLSDHNAEEVNNTFSGNCPKMNSKEDVSNSVCSGHFKTSMVLRTCGSILCLMDELVKVGQVMGYKMNRCLTQKAKKDWVTELCVKNKVNFLALQENNMENMELFSVKMCWGNFVFDYVHSDSTGNSGGILCVWDPNSFRKSNATVFNYFIMIRGVWRQTGNDLLIIAVYAPHDLKDKQMMWDYLTYEIGFSKVVEDAWREGPFDESNAMINMMIKLKYLKTKIREWNKKNMLSAKNVKEKYKDELEALEVIIDKGDGIVKVVNRRIEVVNTLQKIDKICSSKMAQKAKVEWSIEGDENISFFHGMLNKKWSLLNIRGIMVDEMRAHIEMRYPKTLTCDQQVELESDMSNEEIKRAVWDSGIDKSSGQMDSHLGLIPKGCNSSFIALIPKILDVNTVKDFRPISLFGSLYKIVAKILANHLVGVLGDIVNEVQSAFIAGRQILDGPFILNEVLQWCKIKKKQSLIFKVDFEKAYDSVRWDFLDDILKNFGFCEKWCKWIQSCLRSSRGSIIINGSPTKELQFFKGLKQGDPLSPFLFILIMKSLHLSFQRVVDAGIFKGIKLGSSLSISHMFYADDAVFVGQWCDGNITTLVHVLECFYRASGLRINMSKSKIMGVLVDSDKVKCAASKLGCLILKTPFSYLDSKVGGSMSRVHTWNEVVDRVKNQLSKWKMKTLSIGGRQMDMGFGEFERFFVASVREVIDDKSLSEVDFKTRWIKYVPIKVNVHAWKVKNDSLPTRFNVSRRGIKLSSLLSISHMFYADDAVFVGQWCDGNITTLVHVLECFYRALGLRINMSKSKYMGVLVDSDKVKCDASKLECLILKTPFSYLGLKVGGSMCRVHTWNEVLYAKYIFMGVVIKAIHGDDGKVRGYVKDGAKSCRWIWALESSGYFSVASVRKVIDDKSISEVDSKTRWIKYVHIKVNVHAWKVKTDSLPTRFNVSRRGGRGDKTKKKDSRSVDHGMKANNGNFEMEKSVKQKNIDVPVSVLATIDHGVKEKVTLIASKSAYNVETGIVTNSRSNIMEPVSVTFF
nr:RNA-directed DNA polymerase, eukaryota [Tanacetum cinerariifolium]